MSRQDNQRSRKRSEARVEREIVRTGQRLAVILRVHRGSWRTSALLLKAHRRENQRRGLIQGASHKPRRATSSEKLVNSNWWVDDRFEKEKARKPLKLAKGVYKGKTEETKVHKSFRKSCLSAFLNRWHTPIQSATASNESQRRQSGGNSHLDRGRRSGRASKQRECLNGGWGNDLGRGEDRGAAEVWLATKAARTQRERTCRASRDAGRRPAAPDSGETAARKEGETSAVHTAKGEFLLSLQPHERHF